MDQEIVARQDARLRHARRVAADPGAFPRTEREVAMHTLILLGSESDDIGIRMIADENTAGGGGELVPKLLSLIGVILILSVLWWVSKP